MEAAEPNLALLADLHTEDAPSQEGHVHLCCEIPDEGPKVAWPIISHLNFWFLLILEVPLPLFPWGEHFPGPCLKCTSANLFFFFFP